MQRMSVVVVLMVLTSLVVVPSASAQNQAGTIRGKVVDESDQPVPGVTLTLRDTARGTQRLATSDGTGAFQFLAIGVGNDYELSGELSGFQKSVINGIVVNAGFTQNFTLKLKISTVQETVTVTAEKPLVDITTTQESTTVDSAFIQALPLVSRNYTELIPQLPGVSWNRGGRLTFYQFNIHGAEIWGNGYRIDGASNMWSANRAGFLLLPSAIERMEVIAGGIPAEFGEQYGGVIKITTKTGTNRPSGFAKTIYRPNAFYSNQTTGIASQVLPKPPGETRTQEFAFGGPIRTDRLWYFGGLQWNSEQQGSVLTRDAPTQLDFYSFHEKTTWQQSQKSRWDLSISGSPHFARHRPPDNTIAQDAKFTQFTPGMNFVHLQNAYVLDDKDFIESDFSLYHLELTTESDRKKENIGANELRLRAWNPDLKVLYTTGPYPTYGRQYNLKGRYSFRFYRNTMSHAIKAGIDYTEQFGSSTSMRFVKTVDDLRGRPGGGPVTLSENYYSKASLRDRQVGLYVQDGWTIGHRMNLDYGVRVDRESVVGKNNVAPRLGWGFDPTGKGKGKIFANFGVLYSNLNADFYTWAVAGQQGVGTYTIVNPDANYNGGLTLRSRSFRQILDLKNPYTISTSLGFEHSIPLEAKISVTYNHRNFLDNFRRTSTQQNATDVLQVSRNDGRHHYDGVEFVIRKYMAHNFDLLAHYTLAKVEGDTTDVLSPLQQRFQYGPQDWDQRHTVLLSGNAVLPYAVRLTGIFRYASGRPYSIVNDLPTVEAAWVDRQNSPANRNSQRMAANKTIDLSLSRAFRTTFGMLTPGFEMINLANWVNVTGVSTSRSSPGVPTAADTSRMMQVSLEWKF